MTWHDKRKHISPRHQQQMPASVTDHPHTPHLGVKIDEAASSLTPHLRTGHTTPGEDVNLQERGRLNSSTKHWRVQRAYLGKLQFKPDSHATERADLQQPASLGSKMRIRTQRKKTAANEELQQYLWPGQDSEAPTFAWRR